MVLDPVHVDGITRLAGRITKGVESSDTRAFAETVWQEFLDPLVADGVTVLEPIDGVTRRQVDVVAAALQADPFPTRHGLDSGTINPTTYRNGLTMDVAQAAMSAVPSDLDLHRARTVVTTVHTNDATVGFDEDWTVWDEGYSRGRVLHAPRVDQYETAVVHELALSLAESEHALANGEMVSDLLVLDGPVYPKGLLNWARREPELAALLSEDRPRDVVANYVRLVEAFVARDVPLAGFVKSPVTRAITRAVRDTRGNAPWVNDAGFFRHVLDPGTDGERPTDRLTMTGWFVSRGGADRILSTAGDAVGIERRLPADQYEVCYCMLYDPREDAVYRLELPAAFATDASTRDRVLKQVLKGVATAVGPPPAVAKADELARIGRDETTTLRGAIGETIESERSTTYGEDRQERWLGIGEDG